MPNKKEIIKALEFQKELFGDELFQISLKTNSQNSEIKIMKNQIELFKTAKSLEELNNTICNCEKCDLHKGRNKFVFGKGNPNAVVMVIGEGPGADEDAQGEPFVGRAGQLLTDILKAINFTRDEVYIANIVKCRPPANRAPLQSEIDVCIQFLEKQIELISPKLILCLGTTAANAMLNKKETLGNMRQNVFNYGARKVVVTYHPAALLRNPNWKRGCWEDVQMFRKLYDELPSTEK